MINLLKDNKGHYEPKVKQPQRDTSETASDNEKSKDDSEASPEKIDITKYQDPEGLTVGKLEIGLWFLSHRRKFIYILYTILIIVSIICWSIFIYTFGHYVLIGMVQDRKMLEELSQYNGAIPDILMRQAAVPLVLGEPQVLSVGMNVYDIAVKIMNPNKNHWAEFDYHLEGSNGAIFGKSQGFILPQESKYTLSLGNTLLSRPSKVFFVIDHIKWGRISGHNFPDWEAYKSSRLDFTVSGEKFTPANINILSENVNLNELSFTISNNTAYNYYTVDLIILLRDNSNIVAVNRYNVDNFYNETNRNISVTWPGTINRVHNIDIIPEINITDPRVFMPLDLGPGEPK